nr:T9SS type A sorting domain-containing protein [Saprospiraceae bacterium]
VVVSDGSGCTFVSQVLTVMVNSVADKLELPGLVVSPNPVSTTFWIRFNGWEDGNLQIRVVDKWGRTHFQRVLSDANPQNLEVSIEELPTGIYFVNFEANGKRLTRKVLKE